MGLKSVQYWSIYYAEVQSSRCQLPHTTETFKSPEKEVLQIEKDKWQEVHFGIIVPINDSRTFRVNLRIDNEPSCPDPTTANRDSINYHSDYVTYCPAEILNDQRSEEVKCQQVVAFVHGVEGMNNRSINLCIYAGVKKIRPNITPNYTIEVVGKVHQ